MKKLGLIVALLITTSNLYCPPEKTKKGKFLQQDTLTGLNKALKAGNNDAIKACIANADDKNSLVWPIVNYALETNNLAILQPLKGFGLNLEQLDDKGETPLLKAISQRKPFAAQVLLLVGAAPDTANKQGLTPLMFAAIQWDDHSAGQLLLRGANPFLKSSEGKTAFEYATQLETGTFFENPVANILRDLNYALEMLDTKEQNIYRDFLNAIKKGDIKKLNTIIDNNKDFFNNKEKLNETIENSNDQTPLSAAITAPGIPKEKRTDLVEILINRTAFDINAPNNNGATPLHQAILLDFPDEVVSQFIDNDNIVEEIAINAQDNKGATPLHNAVKTNNFDAIEQLVQLGADTTIQDQNGKTPLFYATTTTASNLLHGETVTEEQRENDTKLVKKQNAHKKAVKILQDRDGKRTK